MKWGGSTMPTPLERIQIAWRTADPFALHREVEQLAAEGQQKPALEAALRALLLEVRTSGVDDETEEIINSVWDRITGWCHKSRHIKLPEATLPTEVEIAKLPRWAQVAFAARCARRVLPLFSRNWPNAPKDYVTKLCYAVEVGERSAARAGAGEDWAPAAGALLCAVYVCDAVNNAVLDRNRATEVINATSRAVSKLKDKPENIFDRHIGEVFHVLNSHASVAIANGIAISQETYNAAKVFADSIIRRDFDRLVTLAKAQNWTEDSPVTPTAFGTMWPDGPPAGWPLEQCDENEQLSLANTSLRRISELIGNFAA